MACRNMEKGRKAQSLIEGEVVGASLELAALDLASLVEVRNFAQRFQADHARLDLLFNNAGVMAIPRRETADGFEWQLGANYLSHFALTGLLLPTLLTTPESRVISTSSMAQNAGRINFDDLQGKRSYGRWSAYGQSKLANVLFAFELQRRLTRVGAGTISVCAHPGYASTNLQTTTGTTFGMKMENIMYSVYRGQSAYKGALPQLYAATAPNIYGGEYIGPDGLLGMSGYPKRVRASKPAYDEQVAARLWDVSVELTGVDYAVLRTLAPEKV